MTEQIIIRNSIKCLSCDDEIESRHVHDFKFCKCGKIAVDGGHEYLKRCGERRFMQETSEFGELPDAEDDAEWISVMFDGLDDEDWVKLDDKED